MATPAKPAKPETVAAPKNTKTILIIAIAAVVILLGGGLALYLLLTPVHPSKHNNNEAAKEEVPQVVEAQPVYVELGTFTANLMKEDGDRFLQIAITLKVTKPALEEDIKQRRPELLHRVNMLLQSKRPSELATVDGKEALASDLKAQIEFVLGLRNDEPMIGATSAIVESTKAGSVQTLHASREPANVTHVKGDVSEVLFTSFIIQ